MWILRFHLLESKDYNKITRICKKYGFSARKISPILLAKASVRHMTQTVSWRALAQEYCVSHLALYQFFEQARHTELLQEIFHVFIDRGISLYIGEKKHISPEDLTNITPLQVLTREQLVTILSRL